MPGRFPAAAPEHGLRAILRLGLLGMLLTVYLCLAVATRIPGTVPMAGPDEAPALRWAAPGQGAGVLEDDRPDATRRLKKLLACSLVPLKKLHPQGHHLAGGNAVVYAGIRASASIPADRVRRTAIQSVSGFHRRAPPACG